MQRSRIRAFFQLTFLIATLSTITVSALASISYVKSGAEPTHPKPMNLCATGCPIEMTRITRAFDQAGALRQVSGDEVYSGACYMLSRNYDPATRHYGMVYFDHLNGNDYKHGLFSFFVAENPFIFWTPEDVRKKIPMKYPEAAIIHHEVDYSWVDYQTEKNQELWQYYYTQNDEALYVVARWGRYQYLICELAPN